MSKCALYRPAMMMRTLSTVRFCDTCQWSQTLTDVSDSTTTIGRFTFVTSCMCCRPNLCDLWDKGVMFTVKMVSTCGYSNPTCIVCLHSVGADAVKRGRCSRSCANATYYHAECHDEMRRRCGLECAVCRNPCTPTDFVDTSHVNASHNYGSDQEWLMMCADGGEYNTIVLLVTFVLSPPLLFFRILCMYFGK
jgi:hypothetical protein